MPIGPLLSGDLLPSLTPLIPDLGAVMPQGNPLGQLGIDQQLGNAELLLRRPKAGLRPSLSIETPGDSIPISRSRDPLTGGNNQVQPLAGSSFAEPSMTVPKANAMQTTAADPSGFIRRKGAQLVDGAGNPFTFEGIAFGNENWLSNSNPINHDHSAIDFKRVKDLGMNSVRFYLNYKWFEDDRQPYKYKASAWQWLDKNIAWAKRNDISLILNMHAPQGGYQSQGEGDALWTKSENQNRLAALWKTIANRYKNETTIAGFGLVNEPVPKGTIEKWQTLAQKLADSIRQVNKNHLLFVESAVGIETADGVTYGGTPEQNMFKIRDPNTVYEFHYYGPYEYTHQKLGDVPDGGKYPDYNRIETDPELNWYTATFDNPTLEAGNMPWQFFEGEKYKVTDPKIKAGIAALIAQNTGANGKVAFDDVVVNEYNKTGQLTNVIKFDTNSLKDWGFYSSNDFGADGTTRTGRNDDAAITIGGTTADGSLSNFANPFVIKQGYSYQISGWMQGQNLGANATAQIRLDFQSSNDPIYVRDKKFLLSELQPYINWGKRNNVPLYLGEFGAGRPTFENNKGGLAWVNDVLDFALRNKLSLNYHSYHEDAFGLYPGFGTTVDPGSVNQPLKDLFISKLK
jgi:endoglucanase